MEQRHTEGWVLKPAERPRLVLLRAMNVALRGVDCGVRDFRRACLSIPDDDAAQFIRGTNAIARPA